METASCFTDDLLNFSSDQNDDVLSRALSLLPHSSDCVVADDEEEEELEWISNKDAFPMVESFVDIFPLKTSSSSTTTTTTHFDLSPISVLETNNNNNNNNNVSYYNLINFGGIFNVPKKARSKQLRKPRRMWFECWKKKKTASVSSSVSSLKPTTKSSIGIGRKCLHCASEKTPQWRAGPHGPKTLCNACGVRYKSGRLVPEYRPASSPTFSSEVHSNSHRKIVEMRKNKMMMMTDFS